MKSNKKNQRNLFNIHYLITCNPHTVRDIILSKFSKTFAVTETFFAKNFNPLAPDIH